MDHAERSLVVGCGFEVDVTPMSTRYTQIMPLDQHERATLCMRLCNFFSPINNEKIKQELGLPTTPGRIRPLSLADFLNWSKKQGTDLWPKHQRVAELVRRLEQKGILFEAGGRGASEIAHCYYFTYDLSKLAARGSLWLGVALGPEYIGFAIQQDLVLITGVTASGDRAVGTGLLVLPGVALTCAHVITDMTIDSSVVISGMKVMVEHCRSDANVDVGVVFLEEKIPPSLPDAAFRRAAILEEVVIAGYPSIPRGLVPTVTFQRGEIAGRIEKTMDGYPLELLSAIVRPGNSGGPVVTMDGRIVGIVSRSLERPREVADDMIPMPFFSAIPADVIQSSFRRLTEGLELPWETYD